MRTFGVVEAPPLLDQDLVLFQRVEDLPIEEFVPQLSIEAFSIAILPGTAGHDEERVDAQLGEPVTHRSGHELRTVTPSE